MIENARRPRSPRAPGAIAFRLILAGSVSPAPRPALAWLSLVAVEAVSEEATQLVEQVLAAVDHGRHPNEAVDHALVLGKAHRHSRFLQLLVISHTFVAQRVELAHDDQRRRQARQGFGAQW